jgi:hypothetical protein
VQEQPGVVLIVIGGFAQQSPPNPLFLGIQTFCPKSRLNAQFANRVDQDCEVMAQNLTQNLIHHRGIALAANPIPKLPLHHRESGFYIAPLVVVGEKIIAPELEVVEHLPPHPILVAANSRPRCCLKSMSPPHFT